MIFRGPVRVRIKREFMGVPGAWTDLKPTGHGVFIEVTPDRIRFDTGRFVAFFGPGLSLATSGATMERAKVGWIGTPLLSRPSIVIKGQSPRGVLRAAVTVLGSSDEGLWAALLLAGVRPCSAS
jgi:hypothetical protein